MIDRIKNILVSPKTEWQTIRAEKKPHVEVLTTYVLLLALIPALASFIGYGLIGKTVLGIKIGGFGWGLRHAIIQYVTMVGGVYLSALVINFLADTFNARKNFDQAFSLVAYSYTPMFVGGVFYLFLSLTWLALIAGLYGLYLLYIGLAPMMKVPNEKQTAYFVVSLLVMIVVSAVLSGIFTAILITSPAVTNITF